MIKSEANAIAWSATVHYSDCLLEFSTANTDTRMAGRTHNRQTHFDIIDISLANKLLF